MTVVEKSVLIAHSAQKMFDLVDRCEEYPQFLPWCDRTQCTLRDEKTTVGTLHINFHGIKTQFTTENSKEFPHAMHIRLVDGPFRKLEGFWRFHALREDACKVEFRLHYEFSGRLLEKVIGPVFNRIANTFVEAFVKRADQVYGVES
ncbi:MAG: type II toxin-antitoxin system RatA family toxin [Zoogloeaceae bacterium]|jgi:ribosome-associated toxin RatA of RatAB toxin-antitoxin module|nr:type II toxin-antitoxin system RatA family toxin [Zoogloeaceae bacterium]